MTLPQHQDDASLYARSIERSRKASSRAYNREVLLALTGQRAVQAMQAAKDAALTNFDSFEFHVDEDGLTLRGKPVDSQFYSCSSSVAMFPDSPFRNILDIALFKILGRDAFVEAEARRLVKSFAAKEADLIETLRIPPPPGLAALAESKALALSVSEPASTSARSSRPRI